MADEENITFMDLACILKIGSDTTWEKFGGLINASIFDGANISGTLKQKGLIDFTQYYPGPTSIVVTELGKQLKEEAETKSALPLDVLDDSILTQLFGGKRAPIELQNTLNIRPKDLALRLYKLNKQNFISYELRNGNVELMLTEQGFLKAKTPSSQAIQPQAAAPQGATAPAAERKAEPAAGVAPSSGANPMTPSTAAQDTPGASGQAIDPLAIVKAAKARRKKERIVTIAVVVIVAAILILLYLKYAGIITIKY